ncbi:MAG: hypothetical protein A2X86_04880 [Bdellovibrionales bacterium GWA2_49_15]|nr:MAG: hypothetical protein A2X86_04880 [Bdellovibrionales bacterium GWA2_49_15]
MKFNLVCLLLSFMVAMPDSSAALPSIEGLFKNLNNKPVTEKLVTIKAKIKTIISDYPEGQTKEYYIKVLLLQRNEYQLDVLHTIHTSPDFNNKTVVDYKYSDDIAATIVKGEEDISLSFYALLSMFGTNNSKVITTLLKKRNSDYVNEKEVLNQEKIRLLEAYLGFLKSGEAPDSGNSPLKPRSDAEKNKIDELMGTRFYKLPTALKMVKIGKEISWVLKLENVDAYFDNETFRLKKLKSNLYEQVVAYDFGNYILMDGIHEFPRTINILNEGKGQTNMTILDVNYSDDKTGQFKKIAGEVFKIKLPTENSVAKIPSFLLMN